MEKKIIYKYTQKSEEQRKTNNLKKNCKRDVCKVNYQIIIFYTNS